MYQFRFQPIGIGEFIILMYDMRFDIFKFTGAMRKFNHAFVS